MFGAVALIDKPINLTSFDVVARMRRVFRAQVGTRVGHTGTLDPLATGLLPICLGEATKFAQRMLDADKGYLATVKLGEATDTADREGSIIATGPTEFSRQNIEAPLAAFIGTISQIPPAYSALKIDGRPAYELARAGKAVTLAPREITIHSITLIDYRFEQHEFDIEVICSKGTYIRSLAVDIGTALGTVAHLAALRRTLTGGFALSAARPLEDWLGASEALRAQWLLPVDSLVIDSPRLDLDETQTRDIRDGKRVHVDRKEERGASSYRLYSADQAFLGLGEFAAPDSNVLRAQRLMSTALKS
ncbi:MAG: tRNA pseudouridine(55) synthase TruB [Burkholderiales bacterium]|nr:MAG: tRNA pseudouridine(55) synthase TruB [Burkholderiales bacterium]TAG84039.1 MAG: tRNA pseudouridine(55) synthase TruB [Betaproteobacteria bacterium]